jgi:CheY-like chemotaxis protein
VRRQGRILIVDDQERWQTVLSNTLRRGGFYVDTVATIKAAREQLRAYLYHLFVLDIRMEDTDPNNIEGIDLLREIDVEGLTQVSKVVMLSAYGTKEQMREAFREYRVADFLSKDDFDNLDFLQQVQQIFAQDMQINLNLTIHWQDIVGPEEAVLNLKIDECRVKRDTPVQSRVAHELDDLLCRLFYQADSLLVRPLTPGRSGARVLAVQPFYETGGAKTVVVKFGEAHKIEIEHLKFKEYVQPFIGGGRSTTVLDQRRTSSIGGIVYSLLGAAGDHLDDFGSFYQHADLAEIIQVLDRLFRDTCGAWYANPGRLQPYNLSESYQNILEFDFNSDRLEQILTERLKSVQGKQKLYFTALQDNHPFTNPILSVAGQRLVRPTYVCTTHGDFNDQNILVDTTRHTWLIDFLRTGPGHILRDVAELDSVVRFHLLHMEEATLHERLTMEEALCSIERFSQVVTLPSCFAPDNPALAKAYNTVVHLRTLARGLVAQNPSDDISEYYIALLYYALNTVRFSWLPVTQREHALLCASLLADRLGL